MTFRRPTAAETQRGLETFPVSIPSQAQSHDDKLVQDTGKLPGHGDVTHSSANPSIQATDAIRNQPIPAADRHCHRDMLEANAMKFKDLEAFLTPETLRQLEVTPTKLASLHTASFDPPVTKTSLSELDLVRIMNDTKLRHDLNFEREISFRPNVSGPRSQQKEASANAYWEALGIEFALFIHLRRDRNHSTSSTLQRNALSSVFGTPKSQQIPLRLPRMFTTIRDILKTLVPGSECCGVDQRLDVDLLMQELENGACDVKGLSDWLRRVLLGSCSPLRDSDVEEMVDIIHRGGDKEDARTLVNGLKLLFGILETMKLDVANHQIRYLRLLLVDDSIHFEQNNFLSKIAEGWDVEGARDWFKSHCGSNAHARNRLMSFTRAVVDMVIDKKTTIPATFEHDTDRLFNLQIDFGVELYQEACNQAFVDTLHRLGWIGLPPAEAYSRMLHRVVGILKSKPGALNPPHDSKEIALELVQEAYRLSNFTTLPDERLVDLAQSHLQGASTPASSMYEEVHGLLGNDLAELVDQEVNNLLDLTPLQMLDHLNPGKLATQSTCEMHGMVNIAKRTAHIAVLHWKIWAPILYEQPCDARPPPLAFLEHSNVLSLAGLTEQGTLAETVEDGPRVRSSSESSATIECGPSGAESHDSKSNRGEAAT